MAQLKIRKLTYQGKLYHFESPQFGDGLNIIEGPNGSGKSTFSDFIYFALGGTVKEFQREGNNKHREITTDADNYVELDIEIKSKIYRLIRYIDSNDIGVGGSEESHLLPVRRSKDKESFSDWILKKLEIPIVTFFRGPVPAIINITDILRLIYHNQEPDPRHIFKSADTQNFVSDSNDLRKAIFQLLNGKSFQLYYEKLGALKKTEKERDEAKAGLKIFIETIEKIIPGNSDVNIEFLSKMLEEKDSQFKLLEIHRQTLKKSTLKVGISEETVLRLKESLLQEELKARTDQEKFQQILSESIKVEELRIDLEREVNIIKKIVFSDETLGLFSPDTCPFCLKQVQRKEGHCVCGAPVLEADYQKFFYGKSDYLQMIKSKEKNLETIESAQFSLGKEIETLKINISLTDDKLQKLRSKSREYLEKFDSHYDTSELDEVDQKIYELKFDKTLIEQKMKIENARGELTSKSEKLNMDVKYLLKETKDMELKATYEMNEYIGKFNMEFSALLKSIDKNLRTAKLDDNYMPLLDGGEYKEDSHYVPVRFFYYVTLLKLSLQLSVPFPRFLLIDTINTAGIDKPKLHQVIEILNGIIDEAPTNCQVILTSGKEDFPRNLDTKVVYRLGEREKLLKRR